MEENSIPAASGLGTNPTAPVKVTLSKRTLIRAGIVLVVTLVIVGIVFWFMNRSALPPGVLATVNDQPVYTTYLDKEFAYYPGTKSAEVKKMLTQKIIDDQITLEAAKKEGLITEYPNAARMSNEEYLERTNTVQDLIKKIDENGDVVRGKTVMVWFYNNQYIGPGGIDTSKARAYATIKPLYDKVKSGEIPIDEAGKIIKENQSLASIDPVWQSNALAPFVYYENGPATHWPEFNKLIWNTKPGELTPLYLGGGILRDGKPVEELYIFSQVDQKSTNSYIDYNQWLEQKRKEVDVSYLFKQSFLLKFWPGEAFAQDDGGNNSNDNGSNQSSNDSNSNNDNGSRSGSFNGFVRTQTGAPIPGAQVRIENGATVRNETTDGNGRYDTGVDYALSCLNNPQYITVTYNGQVCAQKTIIMPNGDVALNENFTCGPPPPTPTPKLTCNKPCTTEADCAGSQDGCPVCLPTTGGGKTCQPAPTATPTPLPPSPTPTPGPQCNSACVRSGDCIGDAAKNGCTACLPTAGGGTTCQIPPTPTPTPILTCNTACTTSAACARGVDGCTTCIPNDTGTGSSCKPPPACGTSCKKDSQCAGAKNGCSICGEAGKCTAFSADMCKCDGMDFAPAKGGTTFFPGDNVTFIAFGKVEGSDINVADLQSMTFSLYQSSLTNPNQSTRLAQSTAITPTIVQNDANKVRYKVTWNQKIPSTVPSGSLFRVQAKIKCVAKPGVLGAKTAASSNYYADVFATIQGLLSNTKIVLGENTEDQQQAKSFFPGAKISEKSCSIIKFYFE